MVNPQRSGWRSETRLCTCGLLELERSVLAICRPIAVGTSNGEILLESQAPSQWNLLGKKY